MNFYFSTKLFLLMADNLNLRNTILRYLTVKVSCSYGIGTGILYLSQVQGSMIMLITAKHCICGKNFDQTPVSEDIKISWDEFLGGEPTPSPIQLPEKLCSLYFKGNEKDIAIILIPIEVIPETIRDHIRLNLLPDAKGLRSSYICGFPTSRNIRFIDTILQPNISKFNIEFEPERLLICEECDLTSTSVKGLSGGGLFIESRGRLYLHGLTTEYLGNGSFKGIHISCLNELLSENSVPEEPVSIVEVSPDAIRAIDFLTRNTNEVLGFIKRKKTTGSIKFERKNILKNAIQKFRDCKVLLVYGSEGTGKSVLADDLLDAFRDENGSDIFAFKADQLSASTLTEWMADNLINISVYDLFNSASLRTNKIILIDSIEKLLENRNTGALESFLALVSERSDLKLILTTRAYSLQGIQVQLLNQFPPENDSIEVALLDDSELDEVLVQYPQVRSLLENQNLIKFIHNPFYLNQILLDLHSFIRNNILNERTIKNVLWRTAIEKDNSARGDLFEQVAVSRAKEMRMFISIEGQYDKDVLKVLLEDEILIQQQDDFGGHYYAPGHDIFEDWALVRYIERNYRSAGQNELFDKISDAYAIRRGFRFWVQEKLSDPKTSNFFDSFIIPTIDATDLSNHWKDETIIAFLNSNFSDNFFEENKNLFFVNNASLLLRFIHILRTACREPLPGVLQNDNVEERWRLYSFNFRPVGLGWALLIKLFNQNWDELKKHLLLALGLLLDWQKKMNYFQPLPSESREAGELLLKILQHCNEEAYGDFSINRANEEQIKKGFELLFRLAEPMKTELEEIIRETIDYKRLINDYHKKRSVLHTSFIVPTDEEINEAEYAKRPVFSNPILKNYEAIIENTLSCFESRELCRVAPAIVIEAIKEWWLSKEPEYAGVYDSIGTDKYFGVAPENRRGYSPAESLQTPFWFLLNFHPDKTIDLISYIINYTTERYINSSFAQRDEVSEVDIKLNDGTIMKQWGTNTLWCMYRATHMVTPNALQSMLMALERYLLHLAESKDKYSHAILHWTIDQLFLKSHSVATTSVIASVSLAYPDIVGLRLLPLFRTKEFFDYDRVRYAHESSSLAIYDFEKPYLQEERAKSNKLPHRKEHLETLLLKLSFKKDFNSSILEILDYHTVKADPNDTLWKWQINRMDIRHLKITGEIENGFIVEPEPIQEVKEFVETIQSEREKTLPIHEASLWAWNIFDKNNQTQNTWDNWQKYYLTLLSATEQGFTGLTSFNNRGAIAFIGLKYYPKYLDEKQKIWCFNTILTCCAEFRSAREEFLGGVSLNPMDENPTLAALPLMLAISMDDAIIHRCKTEIFCTLMQNQFSNGPDEDKFKILGDALNFASPDFLNHCFRGLVQLAHIKPSPYREYNLENISNSESSQNIWQKLGSQLKEIFKKSEKETESLREVHERLHKVFEESERVIIASVVSGKIEANGSAKFNLDEVRPFLINKAFHLLSLNTPLSEEYIDFINAWIDLLFAKDKKQNVDYYTSRRSDLIYERSHFSNRIALLLILQPIDISKDIISNILLYTLDKEYLRENYKTTDTILQLMLMHIDKYIEKKDAFMEVWRHIYFTIKNANKKYYTDRLLLDKGFILEDSDWEVIKGKKAFIKDMILYLGSSDYKSVINLLSGFGSKTLLPDGLIWLKQLLIADYSPLSKDIFLTEKLLQRAFSFHHKAIQNDKTLKDIYIDMLDYMVQAGSSTSFYIRELMIGRNQA